MTTEDRLPALPWGHLRRLGKLEAAFEEAGGRGVELAEEIDQLRRDLYLFLGGQRREIARPKPVLATVEDRRPGGCPAMPTSEEEWAAHWSELELLRARCASLEAGLREWLASTIEHPFAGLRALLDDGLTPSESAPKKTGYRGIQG